MRSLKLFKKICIIVLFIVLVVIAQYAYSFIYWRMLAPWQGIDSSAKLREEFKKLSSSEIIKKINVFDLYSPYPEWAIIELAKRKEKKIVPLLIKFIETKNYRFRRSAIGALGLIGDKRAIPVLWKIVGKNPIVTSSRGKDSLEYVNVLDALAALKDERVYGIAVNLATLKEDPNDFRSNGVSLLEAFEDQKAIPILEKIAKNDPEHYIREKAKQAIAHLESIQKEQEQQNKEKSPPTPIN
ncbi:MAG: HEAT repeat domain-containing protein [Candidatus Omnitrophota bacterium]